MRSSTEKGKKDKLSSDVLISFAYDFKQRKKFDIHYYIVLFLVFGLFISSFIIEIEQTINLKGQIVPNSSIARIKHELGGNVSKVLVDNYTSVKKGELILSFDKTKLNTSLKMYKSKLKVIDSEILYTVAFLKNNLKEIQEENLIKEVEQYLINISDTIEQSKQLANASKLISDHKDEVIQQEINKNNIELSRLISEEKMLQEELSKLGETMEIFNKLLKSKNISKIRVIDYEIKYIQAKRELSKLKANIDTKQRENTELLSKRIVQKQDAIKTKYEELVDLNKQKLDLVSNISLLEESLAKLDVKSPISGIVQGLDITSGITIQPNEELFTVIPENSEILFEAKASLAQKAKINKHSKVEVQFDGFNAIQFNRISGRVVNISPYTFDKNPMTDEFSKVIVKLDSNIITSAKSEYPIKLGISGTLFVSAETQSLFSYIFGPIYSAFSNAHGQESQL